LGFWDIPLQGQLVLVQTRDSPDESKGSLFKKTS
jgi:hypothetical protein